MLTRRPSSSPTSQALVKDTACSKVATIQTSTDSNMVVPLSSVITRIPKTFDNSSSSLGEAHRVPNYIIFSSWKIENLYHCRSYVSQLYVPVRSPTATS
jgi:hypothetical protein